MAPTLRNLLLATAGLAVLALVIGLIVQAAWPGGATHKSNNVASTSRASSPPSAAPSGRPTTMTSRGNEPAESVSDSLLACALGENAFLPASAFGDFRDAFGPGGAIPLEYFYGIDVGNGNGKTVPSKVAGYFNGTALEQQYLFDPASDYRPGGDRRLLPLSGSIVLDHPGLLEVYQTNAVFRTETEAVQAIAYLGEGRTEGLVPQTQVPTVLGDEMVVQLHQPEDSKHEQYIVRSVRLGPVITTFSFQGGTELT